MIYLDSSALIKLVFEEPESSVLAGWMSDHEEFPRVSSVLACVEVARSCRAIAPAAQWLADRVLGGIDLLAIDAAVIADAATLEPVGLRCLDSLHLAGARSILSSLTAFVSYDRQLCDAAAAVGLPVVSPA